MEITSAVFESDSMIPKKYTCDGQNINPPLGISDVPAEARSLALIMHDSDAPVSGGWTHWIIFNMDPSLARIAENDVPEPGVQGLNSSGSFGYRGPCPPNGTHHYEFRLYALDTELSLGGQAAKNDLEQAMKGHILQQAILVGLYER
ncbi:MAG: YbhB/YbcL family Raf kinase inhibitor-like protein [Parcubacteria group bacterium]